MEDFSAGEKFKQACMIRIYMINKISLVKVAYWIGKFKLGIFQYCDSNIELFSIAPPSVIALPTLR